MRIAGGGGRGRSPTAIQLVILRRGAFSLSLPASFRPSSPASDQQELTWTTAAGKGEEHHGVAEGRVTRTRTGSCCGRGFATVKSGLV